MSTDVNDELGAEAAYLAWEFEVPGLPSVVTLARNLRGRPSVPASEYGTSLPATVTADLARERTGQQYAPIDVGAVLAAHRVQLLGADLPGEVAYVLLTRRHRVVVVVPEADAAAHQRFSAAHAFGYHLAGPEVAIHLQFARLHGLVPQRARQERAAEFAAALLMPELAVREDVQGMAARSPNSLVEQYRVTPQAMALRLRALGLALAY